MPKLTLLFLSLTLGSYINPIVMVTLFNNLVMILMMEKEIVFTSIQAVLKAEEVKVEQTGQDSLSTLVG